MEPLRSLKSKIARALGKPAPDAPARTPESPYRTSVTTSPEPPSVVYETAQWIVSLCADESGLYVIDQARILRIRRDGGSPDVIASLGSWPASLAVDETHVYWAERNRSQETSGDEGPWRVRKRGGAPERVAVRERAVREGDAVGVDVTAIAAHDGELHWIEHEHETLDEGAKPYRRTMGCRVLQASGDEAVELTCRPHPIERFFLTGESIYWVERGPGWQCCLLSMPRSGGPATTLRRLTDRAPRRDAIGSTIVYDRGRFYWADGQTESIFTATAGGEVTRIACSSFPLAIEAGGGHVVAILGRGSRAARELVRVVPGAAATVTLARFELARKSSDLGPLRGLLTLGEDRAYFGSRQRISQIELGAPG